MTTYKISIECDEATANQLIAMDGRVLGDKFINIITVSDSETGEVE